MSENEVNNNQFIYDGAIPESDIPLAGLSKTISLVDFFLIKNYYYFSREKIPFLRTDLLKLDYGKQQMLMAIKLVNPAYVFIASLLWGMMGVDRFLLGHKGLGWAKLLTFGGLGIWALCDLFLVTNVARNQNLQKVYETVDYLNKNV